MRRQNNMTHKDFEHLIAAYGSKSANWPEDKRRAGQNYAAAHPDAAKAVLSAAKHLDGALDSLAPPPPSELLKARIIKAAAREPSASPIAANDRLPAPGWRGIAAMVLIAFGAGFGGAQFMSVQDDAPPQTELVINEPSSDWQLVAEDLGFSDVYNWVEGDAVTSTASEL